MTSGQKYVTAAMRIMPSTTCIKDCYKLTILGVMMYIEALFTLRGALRTSVGVTFVCSITTETGLVIHLLGPLSTQRRVRACSAHLRNSIGRRS